MARTNAEQNVSSFDQILTKVAQCAEEKIKRSSRNVSLNEVTEGILDDVSSEQLLALLLNALISPREYFHKRLESFTDAKELSHVVGGHVTFFILEKILPLDDWRKFFGAVLEHMIAREVREKLLAQQHGCFYL